MSSSKTGTRQDRRWFHHLSSSTSPRRSRQELHEDFNRDLHVIYRDESGTEHIAYGKTVFDTFCEMNFTTRSFLDRAKIPYTLYDNPIEVGNMFDDVKLIAHGEILLNFLSFEGQPEDESKLGGVNESVQHEHKANIVYILEELGCDLLIGSKAIIKYDHNLIRTRPPREQASNGNAKKEDIGAVGQEERKQSSMAQQPQLRPTTSARHWQQTHSPPPVDRVRLTQSMSPDRLGTLNETSTHNVPSP